MNIESEFAGQNEDALIDAAERFNLDFPGEDWTIEGMVDQSGFLVSLASASLPKGSRIIGQVFDMEDAIYTALVGLKDSK